MSCVTNWSHDIFNDLWHLNHHFFNLCFEFITRKILFVPRRDFLRLFFAHRHKRIKMLSSGLFSPCVLCDWTALQKICLTSIDSARHTQQISDYHGEEKNAYVIAHFSSILSLFCFDFPCLNASLKFSLHQRLKLVSKHHQNDRTECCSSAHRKRFIYHWSLHLTSSCLVHVVQKLIKTHCE